MFARLLSAELFTLLLVFVRVGAAIMTLPGYGEPFIPPRMRLLLALLISLLVTPLVAESLPGMPASALLLGLLILGEALIGYRDRNKPTRRAVASQDRDRVSNPLCPGCIPGSQEGEYRKQVRPDLKEPLLL